MQLRAGYEEDWGRPSRADRDSITALMRAAREAA